MRTAATSGMLMANVFVVGLLRMGDVLPLL